MLKRKSIILSMLVFLFALLSCETKKQEKELTEKELLEIELKKRYEEEQKVYAELPIYNGKYEIYTENEGVKATLFLHYLGDKQFQYRWNLEVNQEEIQCRGALEGKIMMDQTQHGFSTCDNSTIHFNFNGFWDGFMVVEMVFEDQKACKKLKGDCNFSGTYRKPESKK